MAENWFEKNAPKKDDSAGGNWFTKNAPAEAQSQGLGQQIAGGIGELYQQGKNVASGLKEAAISNLLKFGGVIPPSSGTSQLGEIVAAPARELAGWEQPGMPPESAPQTLTGRAAGAVSSYLGGDPAQGRVFWDQGEYGKSLAATWGVPLATVGLGRMMRTKSKAPLEKRVGLMTVATGPNTKELPAAYRKVLDGRMAETGTKGFKGTHYDPIADKTRPVEWPAGKVAGTVEEVRQLAEATMSKAEAEFDNALGPYGRNQYMAKSVGDRIRAQITPAMEDPNANDEFTRQKKYLEDRAAEYDKPKSLATLNSERQAFFRKKVSAERGRIALRTDEETMADAAAEAALKDFVYDEVGRLNGKKDYFRQLKADQSALYTILDSTADEAVKEDLKNAIHRGTSPLERVHTGISAGSTGHVSSRVIGAGKMLESLPSKKANKKIRKAMSPSRPSNVRAAGVAGAGGATANTLAAQSREDRSNPPPISVEQWADR